MQTLVLDKVFAQEEVEAHGQHKELQTQRHLCVAGLGPARWTNWIGPIGAVTSSFFNSINSVFRGHVTSQAIIGSFITSLTTQFCSYTVKDGREGKPLPIILCDTMGLEESIGAWLDVDDASLKVICQTIIRYRKSVLGLSLSCVVPVKNYSEELEFDPNCDILLLSAIIQMLRFADNYFDEICDKFSNIATKG